MALLWHDGQGGLLLDTVAARPAVDAPIVIDRARWVTGIALSEMSGAAPGRVALWTGPPDSGQLLADLGVTAGSMTIWQPGLPGLPAPAGLWVVVTAGDVSVSITTAERQPA